MNDPNKKVNYKFTNLLIQETSLYLLQHAHNPVHWHAWNPETLEKAKNENKMLLISIGYSACHWCHVMEHETFENERMAELMNSNFICIKVDREERPDVDAVYMNAVQLIHGNGGWPLNCFALPDGKPFYGGTYFQPSQWEALLKNIIDLYQSRRIDLEDQAQQILEGINQENIIGVEKEASDFHKNDLDQAYQNWKGKLDYKNGGSKGAPKFPMPSNLLFLLRYGFFTKNEEVLKYILLSLDKIAKGGIYDHLAGGFARYSVDAEWKVPHFEKMLYDNAQLISLYVEGFQLTKNPEFLQVAQETADFVLKDLTSSEGIFYSALDADTDGEEGKFYVWTKKEFDEILGSDSDLISQYFEIDAAALWEDDKNVLMHTHSPEYFADIKEIDKAVFSGKLKASKQKLLNARNLRTRPGLDDKSLTSWNALMIKALAHLAVISENNRYLDAALKAANLIYKKLSAEDGGLLHNYKNGVASIDGFLEDYAFTADAALELFQVTADKKWIDFADSLTEYTIQNFYDEKEGLFWFTNSKSHDLISRKKEIYDNVIPASNSTMATVLFTLSKIYENQKYEAMAKRMAGKVLEHVKQHPASFSNWANLIQIITGDFYEIVVVGKDFKEKLKSFNKYYYPAKLTIGSKSEVDLPIFKNRFVEGKTLIYVCSNNVCKRPVEHVEEALLQLGS